jgi:uncharacterized protein (DUF3084 family)
VTRQFTALVVFVVALSATGACTKQEQPVARDAGTQEQPAARPAETGGQPVTRDATAPESAKSDAEILADFKDRADRYVALRKKVDDAAPPLKKTDDPGKIREAQQILAELIRNARSTARQGDILTPEIATYFRRLLRPEAKDPGTKAAIKDDNPGTIPFKVNGEYPDNEPLSTVPPNVLQTLPKLPDDIEYRFAGKHMILRDVRANLIIDYMMNAIP